MGRRASLHNRRKKEVLRTARDPGASPLRLWWGLGPLGFTSLYREGFEVVLFLQNYRMKLGGTPVLRGVLIGLLLSGVVALLTFFAQHRLPYRKMLITTGVLLGGVLLVMVGEQAQEMQLARWLSATEIPALARVLPPWTALWFGLSPTAESLGAQLIAALLVLGSYALVRFQLAHKVRGAEVRARRTRETGASGLLTPRTRTAAGPRATNPPRRLTPPGPACG